MNLRTLLVPLDGGPSGKAAMASAVALAKHTGGHIEALHVRADPKAAVPLLGEGMSGAMIEEMIELAERESDERARDARACFDAALDGSGVTAVSADEGTPGGGPSASFSTVTGREDEVVARRGRVHDLIVVGRPGGDEDIAGTVVLNAALFETGRPVLVAADDAAWTLPDKVAVAWNGSVEGARAVSFGLPFLDSASAISLLTAETDSTGCETVAELAGFLRWHGITADPVCFSPAGHSVGKALLMECDKVGAGMLVMGAYTHSRVRQMILGGVTSHVLSHATIPVLLAH